MTETTTISFSALPALGTELDGGIFCGVTTLKDGRHAAVILLHNKAQEHMRWDRATKWAAESGGQLPSRPVAALLYANAKDLIDPSWHWSSEEHESDGSCAWNQYFDNGFQDSLHKSYEGRARAVRLIQLTA